MRVASTLNQNNSIKPLAAILMAVALTASLTACKGKSQGGMQMPPSQVSVQEVKPQTVNVEMEYTGQISGVRDAEVRARVTGILLRRNYIEGATVQAGQSLFTIDPAPYQAALAKAEADMASAEAKHAQTTRDVARLKPLIEARAISQKDYDDAASAEQIASADVKSAEARVTDAKLNLSYTRVAAPISGVTGRIQVTEGALISGPDILLTTITQTSPIYAIASVSDNDQLRLNHDVQAGELQLPKDGRFDVSVTLADGSVYPHTGKVNFSDIRLNPATGTSEVRAALPNPNSILRPGQFVRVKLIGAKRINALMVAQRAVLEGPQGKYVYVVNAKSQVETRPVEVGDWTGEQWVINKGLQAGDKVIVDGVAKIGPGAPVKVTETIASTPDKAANAPVAN
ncbi:MAG TPA: efflux RND transporter periplasmic adaptor subunit [Methylophilaceae bacterium]|jgi:membrane fusion protein (multidrug efflux system)